MDPFAPQPSRASSSALGATCPSCGAAFDPTTGSYDGAGRLVCRTCAAGAQAAAASKLVVDQDPTTTRNLWGAAAASAGLGVVTCCISGMGVWFFVASIMPISSGATVLWLLATKPNARAALGGQAIFVALLAATGLSFGLLGAVLGLLIVGGLLEGR